MLCSIRDNFEALRRVKMNENYEEQQIPDFTKNEIAEINHLIAILEPFESTTKDMSGNS